MRRLDWRRVGALRSSASPRRVWQRLAVRFWCCSDSLLPPPERTCIDGASRLIGAYDSFFDSRCLSPPSRRALEKNRPTLPLARSVHRAVHSVYGPASPRGRYTPWVVAGLEPRVKGVAFNTIEACFLELRGVPARDRARELMPETIRDAYQKRLLLAASWYPISWNRQV